MDIVVLSQWQFAITSIYHFFFVPLTLGLSVLVAIMETLYVRTGNEDYKRMTKFWGKLFLINFGMGVVTGIALEFQFGMNWAEYSRFVGNIFGAPLAIEALLAFFLESTFIGVWIFGWEKLSKKMHLVSIWLVAVATNLSSLWILIANSFMQHPVGFELVNPKLAVMTDFSALLLNPYVWGQFPHTVLSGFTTGAFFVLGISVYHLIRKNDVELFKKSFRIATIFGAVAILGVMGVGHFQAQYMVEVQPMKMAAAEALWQTEDPAGLSILTVTDTATQTNLVDIRAPYLLSILAFNTPYGEVQGMADLQKIYEKQYGPGNYIPNIHVMYWTFRIMIGAGLLMLAAVMFGLFLLWKRKDLTDFSLPVAGVSLAWIFPYFIALPYLANTAGWMMTEMGRQPWIVFGQMKTADAVSPMLTPGMVLTTLIGFLLVYGVLMIADVYLLAKYAKAGPATVEA